ncbi:hypothetical protein V6N11_076167 [Hibiscus sabdariffa]|uniref:Uncharacterized protein n=1 Tax=Hibiscus sabdariffa TaxID=183260 RepID=A0ABR2Q5G3_9ROSI
MNGSGNEKLPLAIDDERAAVVSHIAGKRRAEQRSKETKQGEKEEGDVDKSDSDEFMCISVGIARGV